MRKILFVIIMSCAGALLFCLLTGAFSLLPALAGLSCGFLAGIAFSVLFPGGPRMRHPLRFLWAVIKLIGNIFLSSIRTVRLFFAKTRVEIRTIRADDDSEVVFQANAISLTPGTVAVDYDRQELVVLELVKKEEESHDPSPAVS